MFITFAGMLNKLGEFLYFSPQAYTFPSPVIAYVVSPLAITFLMFFRFSFVGWLHVALFPIPSCPCVFCPHVYTFPSLSSAITCVSPTAMSIIVSGISIFVGSFLFSVFPIPSCPFPFVPQLHTVPSAFSAIVNSFPFSTFADASAFSSFTTFTHMFPVCVPSVPIRFTLPIFPPVIL